MSVLADVGHLLVYDQKSKKKLVQIKKMLYICTVIYV